MARFNLDKLLIDVFQPVKEDRVLVIYDTPHGDIKDNEKWEIRRREMAPRWHEGFTKLSRKVGFFVHPIARLLSNGFDGWPIPGKAGVADKEVELEDIIKDSTVVVALTEWSVSAPLYQFIKKYPYLRVASMPEIWPEMEETALAADYKKIGVLGRKLVGALKGVSGANVVFSTGHECYFDLRFRRVDIDDGMLPPDKKGFRLINLPSGEVFQAVYEGERPGVESKTHGELPVSYNGETVVYRIDRNKITEIMGDGREALAWRSYFDEDPARRNIAEFGLGCNDCAVVRGNPTEDEKAGFHWAYGLSDHMGGVWGADRFKDPEKVVHRDNVYAKGSPITVREIVLHYPDGTCRNIWDGEWYCV